VRDLRKKDMQNQCSKKEVVGEAGPLSPLKYNDNSARTRHTRPIDRKRLSSALPAPWMPDQWLGYGKAD
jgi:hypothetical protein